MAKLSVKVNEAKDLVDMDIGGKSDPYVELSVEDGSGKKLGKAVKTKTVKNTLAPVWKEEFTL